MEIFDLLTKRFGERFSKNLTTHQSPNICYNSPIWVEPTKKCTDCAATKFRQDLPFWVNGISKDFMVIAQDAGKGEEHDKLNSVFSIHRAYYEYDSYISEWKHRKYYEYLNTLMPLENFLEHTYFTDLIKCAFSTSRELKVEQCPCRFDILTEIQNVKPKFVFLIGSKATNTLKNIFSERSVSYNPSREDIVFLINKKQTLKISAGTYQYPGIENIQFISVPQLGQNRFSNTGFENMKNEIVKNIQPLILSGL
jgi:hypothetical protein